MHGQNWPMLGDAVLAKSIQQPARGNQVGMQEEMHQWSKPMK